MKKGYLFLNGEPPEKDELRAVANARTADRSLAVYCTDGAYRYLRGALMPDTVLGDFDSMPCEEASGVCEILAYPPEKDYTDGFLAVKIMAERGYRAIDISGAYGGRPDMAESNFGLLALAHKAGVRARFCGNMQTYLVSGVFATELAKGATFSMVPFSDMAHIVYTKGLKYSLHDYAMYKYADIDAPDYVMGVSNEALGGRAEVAIHEGLALI
ncbi:MAG: thiamine diphosphokinase, partial [Clostridiales bacterium]|nr:thiamine diphosphokinase [Clostridiales bacterium]